MGANRTMVSPEAYPAAFLAAVRNGGGVFYAADLPWTTGSAAKRFRLLLALLRGLAKHDLHPNATPRWHVEASPRALVVRVQEQAYHPAAIARPLIEAALTIGVNPNGTPREELT